MKMVVFRDRFLLVPVDRDVLVACAAVDPPDQQLHAVADLFHAVVVNLEMMIMIDHLQLVAGFGAILFLSDNLMAITIGSRQRIVLRGYFQIPLRMHKHLFLIFGVIEANLIEPRTSEGGVTLYTADVWIILVLRIESIAKVGRHLFRIIDAANDHRLIRVPFDKGD